MTTKPCPITGYEFQSFGSWYGVTQAVKDRVSLYYHAPLDGGPRPAIVLKQFKNGKLRIAASEAHFTADAGHLERFYFLAKVRSTSREMRAIGEGGAR